MSKKKGDFCGCHFGSKIGLGIKFRTCLFSVGIPEFSYPLRELSWTGKIKQAAVIILDAEYCLRHETPGLFLSLRYKGIMIREMNIRKCSFRWHYFCTIWYLQALLLNIQIMFISGQKSARKKIITNKCQQF